MVNLDSLLDLAADLDVRVVQLVYCDLGLV